MPIPEEFVSALVAQIQVENDAIGQGELTTGRLQGGARFDFLDSDGTRRIGCKLQVFELIFDKQQAFQASHKVSVVSILSSLSQAPEQVKETFGETRSA